MTVLPRIAFPWLILLVVGSACRPTAGVRPVDTGTVVTTGPVPCEADASLTIDQAEVTQPWQANEAQFSITLSGEASVAVACTLDRAPAEVHLVESDAASTSHTLQMGGLLAGETYQCSVAPVCPTLSGKPTSVVLETRASSDPGLPSVNVVTHESTAGRDYVLMNHQLDQGGPTQRMVVFDRDGQVRWHAQRENSGNAVSFQPASGMMTIAGGWFPGGAWQGRPLQIGPFGSDVVYDLGDDIPDPDASYFHHDGRELPDGRFLTLEETPVPNGNGGMIDAMRVRIVNPATGSVDFDWNSQAAMEAGILTRGSNQGDVYHANWVDLQTVNGQEVVYISVCFQNQIVAVDVATGNVRWTLGAEGDFRAVDTLGNDLGRDGFMWCSHGLQVEGDRLLVYDNGRDPRPFSRATEYQIDEAARTATLVWEYTEPNWYEQSLGGVDWTLRGDVMIGMGHGESFSQSPGDRTTVVEADGSTGNKLWEMQFNDVRDMSYKVDAIDPCAIFSNAKYCRVTERRLETLESIF